MSQDKLYAVGRFALLEIDPETGAISNRFRFPNPGMPNDVTADDRGQLYITDSRRNIIYRFSDGRMEEWLADMAIIKPNGILFDQGKLLIGASEDGCIKQVDPESKAISNFICLEGGALIDGIASDGQGGYFVSDFNGRIFRIHADKKIHMMMDGTAPQKNYADFEFIPEKNLLVVPGFGDHFVTAYKVMNHPK
jgi:streptogramin lyase